VKKSFFKRTPSKKEKEEKIESISAASTVVVGQERGGGIMEEGGGGGRGRSANLNHAEDGDDDEIVRNFGMLHDQEATADGMKPEVSGSSPVGDIAFPIFDDLTSLATSANQTSGSIFSRLSQSLTRITSRNDKSSDGEMSGGSGGGGGGGMVSNKSLSKSPSSDKSSSSTTPVKKRNLRELLSSKGSQKGVGGSWKLVTWEHYT
jgi:hypothetical protein